MNELTCQCWIHRGYPEGHPYRDEWCEQIKELKRKSIPKPIKETE